MKIEERAIRDVTNFRDNCKRAAKQMNWKLEDTSFAVWEFTLSALEKQRPKEPVQNNGTYCPNCRGVLEVDGYYPRHCDECGQALKWSK